MKDPKAEADRLLVNIAINQDLLAQARRQADVAIERVKKAHAPKIAKWSSHVKDCEKALEKTVKKHRGKILAGADRADLDHGSVLLKRQTRVKQIKGMLDLLKTAGLTAAVKVAKEVVDWDKVDSFDDDSLARLGTERVEKDVFSYELKFSGKADGHVSG